MSKWDYGVTQSQEHLPCTPGANSIKRMSSCGGHMAVFSGENASRMYFEGKPNEYIPGSSYVFQ